MNKRIKIAKRVDSEGGSFGRSSGGQKYEWVNKEGDHGFYASEKFDKGMKSLREGSLDAYNTVMFRMRYNADIDRWCLIKYQGRWYQIQSLNEDYQTNELQITATEMPNQKVTIVDPPSNNDISDGSISGETPNNTEIGI